MLRSVPSSVLLLLAACTGPATVPLTDQCAGDDCRIELWVHNPFAQTSDPTLNVEFTENGGEVGASGWHIQAPIDTEIELDTTLGELQRLLEERGHNVIVSNTMCVRWNVNYGNGRYLCEEQGDELTVVADTYFLWGANQWEMAIWQPPDEDGCSVVACAY